MQYVSSFEIYEEDEGEMKFDRCQYMIRIQKEDIPRLLAALKYFAIACS